MSKEVPGNAIMSQMAYQQELINQAQQLIRFEGMIERLDSNDVEVQGLSIRLPRTEGEDYLITVRGVVSGQRSVCFHAGITLAAALRGALARMENNTVRWKDDGYGG